MHKYNFYLGNNPETDEKFADVTPGKSCLKSAAKTSKHVWT